MWGTYRRPSLARRGDVNPLQTGVNTIPEEQRLLLYLLENRRRNS